MQNSHLESYSDTQKIKYTNTMTKAVHESLWSDYIELPKIFPRSPLRYPGGKTRAVKSIYSFIPSRVKKLCSPFLGGASIELACSTRMIVYGSDIFEPLISFWKVLIKYPNALVEKVNQYYPLSKTRFYHLQKNYLKLEDEVERAAAFFVLNRSSFSGTTLSGGMSPGHPRFTESAIDRLRNFKANNLIVECCDFKTSINKHKDAFLYLDPPYMNNQNLYGIKGNTHKGFNHYELAELLYSRDQWIMSYNDCHTIRSLYKNYTILSVQWVYGMSKNKKSNEVLILSRDLSL